jgi:bacillithiol synthase
MQLKKVPLAETHAFTPFFLDFVNKKKSLEPFYGRFPEIKNFKAQVEEKTKSFPQENRAVLVKTLQSQYQHLKVSENVSSNIQKLG